MLSKAMFCPFQSGKLVMKMFQKIQELIDDKDALICVLIDEVCVPSYMQYVVCETTL